MYYRRVVPLGSLPPLGVYDFQTRTSIIQCSREGAIKLSRAAAILASEEGLYAHAESALARLKG